MGLIVHLRWDKKLRLIWVVLGVAGLFPLTAKPSGEEPGIDWAKEKQFWAFRIPVRQHRPEVKNRRWPAQPLDYFVLSRIEKAGLSPAAEAERRVLIRRLSFDLRGLPPTAAEVEGFLSDKSEDAYARIVEDFLNSFAFGERMTSLWLPLARYAEDQAHQVGKDTKFFYPNAFRYREWVISAFNRDLPYDQFLKYQLAADQMNAGPENLAALGFIGLGPKYYNRNRLEVMADEWEDRVDTVSRTMLGLTVACARCHDHKYDPVTQEDYYGLAGVFASTKMINKSPEGTEEKKEAEADKMAASTLHMVEDGSVTNLNVFLRGNVDRKGPIAERRFLRILSESQPQRFEEGSGRKDLAEAIANPKNPLTARVIVNRLWSTFSGKPIVASTSNFGHSGEKPNNPELLDDLAARFIENGWSIKKLVREIVLSSTYRQSSTENDKGRAADSSNDMLWRMNRRRLSIEQWRDAVLFVAGDLEPTGGKSKELDDSDNRRRTVYGRISRLKLNDMLMQFDYPDANVHAEKRSVTTSPMQKLFLLNNPFVLEQAKMLAARLERSPRPLGGEGKGEGVPPASERIENAYRVLFARKPEKREVELAENFLKRDSSSDMSRWEEYVQMLLVSNEMFYVD